MILNKNNSLGDWATQFSGASRIFIKHKLDFCCGGNKSLEEASSKYGLDPEVIIKEIIEASKAKPTLNWDKLPLQEVVDLIIENFHQKHREDLKILIPLAKRVERVHGSRSDAPTGVGNFLEELAMELESHMQKEEQILFPMIKSGNGAMAGAPIRVMMLEHENHGNNLEKLRKIAHDYQKPEDACSSWRTLYEGLEVLEREVMEHVSIENNILFPKALSSTDQPEEDTGCCGSCT